MNHYRLTVYKSNAHDNSPNQPKLMWIELLDLSKNISHLFSFLPGDHISAFGGCGFFKKINFIPANVHTTADISITEAVFAEMVKEGNWLHNQYILYDDGMKPASANYH